MKRIHKAIIAGASVGLGVFGFYELTEQVAPTGHEVAVSANCSKDLGKTAISLSQLSSDCSQDTLTVQNGTFQAAGNQVDDSEYQRAVYSASCGGVLGLIGGVVAFAVIRPDDRPGDVRLRQITQPLV